LEQLRALGQWLQEELKVPQYKNQALRLNEILTPFASKEKRQLGFKQALALQVFKPPGMKALMRGWRHFIYSEILPPLAKKNSCLFLRIHEEPFWKIIPLDAEGKKQDEFGSQ